MTVKSTIDIDINDEAFKRFNTLFEKYQAKLKAMPADWSKVNKPISELRGGFEAIVAAMLAQAEMSKKQEKQTKTEVDQHKKLEVSWKRIADYSRNVARNARDATRDLLRWTSLSTIATGLVGAGSLFGLERLAAGASAGRRSSLGLGVGFGAQRAFGVNFGRFVDPDAFLSGIAGALTDQQRRVALSGIGMTAQEQRGDTGQVAVNALQRLKALADRTPLDQLAQVMQATRAGELGISLEDFRRLKATPQAEFADQIKTFGERSTALNLDDTTLKRWQDFNYQLDLASKKIDSAFITGLDPLVKSGVLTKLSDGFANAVQAFASSPALKNLIESDLVPGLDSFAKYVGTPKFQQDVENFANGIATLAGAIGWLIDHLPKASTVGAAGGAYLGGRLFGLPGAVGGAVLGGAAGAVEGGKPGTGSGGFGTIRRFNAPFAPSWWRPGAAQQLGALEQRFGLPPGLLMGVYGAESNYGRRLVSSKGALGPFQFMPATAAAYGIDPMNFGQAAGGAARMYRDLLNQYGGDVSKAAAAYNWGSGNLQKEIATYGAAWRANLPKETKRYVDKVVAAAGSKVTIHVENNTGGNSIITASQLAAGVR